MDLFDHALGKTLEKAAPLAARMRPRTLDEYVGQGHILGPGRLLRRAIQADQLTSLIFYGPPGVGKTSLARVIAGNTRAHFASLNAVLAGVADIRQAVAQAAERLAQHATRTILFVDEVHRFNKAQQDALLPHVENGTVVFIGATTENPYFEVNKTIVSRSRIFELRPLDEDDLLALMAQALGDPVRGYGGRDVQPEPEALAHIAHVANGDGRAALNALELAVETTAPDPGGVVRLTLAVAEESIQRKSVLYDKDGDAHFDTISAFIKSMRGSDPDAALYWMARMVYAGEDPRFILRRMLIFAGEDVGLADPQAMGVVVAASQAFDYVGLPEGRYHLALACLYLCLAPKSNSTMGFFDALGAVETEQEGQVPDPLKDASRDKQGFGHGQGYLYPHAYRDHWVAQQYLPDSLRGRVFFHSGQLGAEAAMGQRLEGLREAQLAAAEEGPAALFGPLEGVMTPSRGHQAEFVRRGQADLALHLADLALRMLTAAGIGRHHLVLDTHAAGGLLTWEAVARAKEGGVWARVSTPEEARRLTERGRLKNLPAALAPVVLVGPLEALPELVARQSPEPVRFDVILARGGLGARADKPALLAQWAGLLALGMLAAGGREAGRGGGGGGLLIVAEPCPALSGRVLPALGLGGEAGDGRKTKGNAVLDPGLIRRALAAEEALLAEPALAWRPEDLAGWCEQAGLAVEAREVLTRQVSQTLEAGLLARWFQDPEGAGVPAPDGNAQGTPDGGEPGIGEAGSGEPGRRGKGSLGRLLALEEAQALARYLGARVGRPFTRQTAVVLLSARKI